VATPTAPVTVGGRIASVAVSIAAALVILGASIVPFLTPAWIHGEQLRSGATDPFGEVNEVKLWYSDAIVHDLAFGGDFNVGTPRLMRLLDDREVAHMRDVRGVFQGLAILIIASAIWLGLSRRRARSSAEARAAWWRSVSRGGTSLAAFMVVVGVLAVVAFDAMFEVFHELLFPAGSFSFDPAKERLVQLYPDQFWSDTTLALGLLAVTLSIAVAIVAAWRARRLERLATTNRSLRASASLTPRSAP
jgi:integral membrane protein (TIGR01906 family)